MTPRRKADHRRRALCQSLLRRQLARPGILDISTGIRSVLISTYPPPIRGHRNTAPHLGNTAAHAFLHLQITAVFLTLMAPLLISQVVKGSRLRGRGPDTSSWVLTVK